MTLIKTSLISSIAVIVKMLTLLGLNKVLAVYVGPAGYAALGQFQNAVQMITTFASGAINTGVTKYTAEYYEDEEKQRLVWRTAGTIAFVGSLFTSVLIIIFKEKLAFWFLKDIGYASVFTWFAATLVFFIFNTLLLAILNGKKEIVRYVVANIFGSLFSLLLTSFMAIKFGIYGALIGLAVYQSLSFFVTLLLCYKASWFKLSYLLGRIDTSTALNLSKYTAMALTSAISVPVSHIFVRNYLGETLSWQAAGYWEAMIKLSSAYLLFITSTLSVYYLPRLSSIVNIQELRTELFKCLKTIAPLVMLTSILIYSFRLLVINLLFDKNFENMEVLFKWQLIGDSIKVCSWLFAFIYIAKGFTFLYIFAEVAFSLLYVLTVAYFIPMFGLKGASIAYALNYFLHFIFVFSSLKLKRAI